MVILFGVGAGAISDIDSVIGAGWKELMQWGGV